MRTSQPEITDAAHLYEYYRGQENEQIRVKIMKDLERTDIGNPDYKQDLVASGENQLFNVLNAYAMFDKEISYCQGINFIVMLLLKHLRNEEDAFYCLVHVMQNHDWRGCYDLYTSKLINLLELLECILETGYPEVYNHIMTEIEISLVPVFASIIQTIFIYDSPEHIATHIFDVFLLDGDSVIFTVLIKMIELKEEKILATEGHELLDYLRKEMSEECLREFSMDTLMD